MTDFVGLCRAARELPGPDTHDRLWSAWFALPAWHLITAASPIGPLPFSNFVNGQRCVLAFTTAAHADGYARMMGIGPPMELAPEAMIHKIPLLKGYGVMGFVVDLGPDGFHTSLDQLWTMFHHFRRPPVAAQPVTSGPAPMSVDWWLALPAWHVVVSREDPTVPDFATLGGDLVARIYSSAQAVARLAGVPTPPISVMPPAQALSQLADLELVRFAQFDNQLVVDVIDLKLRLS